jgi:hypothetical protein
LAGVSALVGRSACTNGSSGIVAARSAKPV